MKYIENQPNFQKGLKLLPILLVCTLLFRFKKFRIPKLSILDSSGVRLKRMRCQLGELCGVIIILISFILLLIYFYILILLLFFSKSCGELLLLFFFSLWLRHCLIWSNLGMCDRQGRASD